jgi:hypothetical protein
VLDAAAGGDAARRRAGADARGAARLPHRLRGSGDRLRPRVGRRRAESRRKTRTLAGNYQILAQEPRLLLPFVNPVWLQYMSHKVGRLVVPWALLGVLLSSRLLARDRLLYARALGAGHLLRLALAGALFRARALRARRLHVRDDERLGVAGCRAAARARGLADDPRRRRPRALASARRGARTSAFAPSPESAREAHLARRSARRGLRSRATGRSPGRWCSRRLFLRPQDCSRRSRRCTSPSCRRSPG